MQNMDKEDRSFTIQRHKRILLTLSVLSRVLSATLLICTTYLPLFDSSPKLLLKPPNSIFLRWVSTLLRWDAIHYAHIAQEKLYVFEHERAFFLGTPQLMQLSVGLMGMFWHPKDASEIELLLCGGAIMALMFDGTSTLYELTLHFFDSPSMAFLTALLSLLPSSPPTLRHAVYAEPFFAYVSYEGMLYCTQDEWFRATVMFFFAGMLRSNGSMLAGFLVYGMIIDPWMRKQKLSLMKVVYCATLAVVTLAPFLWHQYMAYGDFCTSSSSPPWCSNSLPFIYSYVQSKYWDVGFLRYWTLQQLPNFVISAPVLALLLYTSIQYVFNGFLHRLWARLSGRPFPQVSKDPFLAPSIAPHAIHALVFTSIMLFAAHTQIILRLASSMPFTYWSAAQLCIDHPKWGRWWTGWSVVWGVISTIMWGAFLPPA